MRRLTDAEGGRDIAIVISGVGIDSTPLNVRDYGAAGNGAANDTAAIQAAVDAAFATNAAVYFPPGTYMTDAITLHPKVFLQGAGKEATWIKARAGSQTLFSYLVTSYVTGFTFRDMTIDSNGFSSVTAIKIDGGTPSLRCSGVLIENVTFWGTAAKAVWLKYCAGSRISGCISELPIDGFTIDNCADTNITDTFAILGAGIGFNILGTSGATTYDEGTRLVNCVTNGQATGLSITQADWGLVSNCSFTTCSAGAVIMNTSSNWSFYACDFAAAPASTGFYAPTACSAIAISGCKIAVNSFGILATGSLWAITGNILFANGNVDIYLSNLTNSVVANNVCSSVGVAQSIFTAGTITGLVANGNLTIGTVSGFDSNDHMAANLKVGTVTPTIYSGTGSPESAVTAPMGSLYLNLSGGASTTLYVKQSGTGNTGWVAK